MRSADRYRASPSAPPKPPSRTGTGCAAGDAVRPASERITSAPPARHSANRRDSAVPPRMRMRRMSLPDPVAPETAASRRWLSIVGIGEDGVAGLSTVARGLVSGAEIVFGGKRHLALAAPLIRGAARPWPSPFERGIEEVLAQRGRQICVLASGDPYIYGVGSVLARHVPPEQTVVVPAPSAFSLAAARLGWALPETALISLHGRALDLVRPHLQPGARILALTSDGAGPAALAHLLAEDGFGATRLTVLEALGGARERVRTTTAAGFDLDSVLRSSTESRSNPAAVVVRTRSRAPPSASSTVNRVAPNPSSASRCASAAGPAPSEVSARMRAPGCRCGRTRSSARPCSEISAVSGSAQPSRAAARLNADGAGTTTVCSGGTWRARTEPTP